MKVSILISNYNYARYLPAALDSVLAQTYRDFEIIVVDDGSTDDSRAVLTRYQSQHPDRMRVLFQPNQGQGAAFNAGFAIATGDVIAFLDADDVWYPPKLQRVAEALRDPDIIGVMHQSDIIDRDGKVTDPGPTPARMPTGDLAPLVAASGGAWCFVATSGLSYRRSVLDSVFPVAADDWTLCADGVLAYCTAFLGPVKTRYEILSGYRVHGANNHSHPGRSQEKRAKAHAGVEMTNRYLNDFLARIGSPYRVSLSDNLQYRRDRFYARGNWDSAEAHAIARLILRWPLYGRGERAISLLRFLLRCFHLAARSSTRWEGAA
ncbi:MAG: glycosyltransferase family 2 protein [Armatimonadetes bacterium]|nr:glycosyltransferase family 2 protein [Armatimonadota bacterium]